MSRIFKTVNNVGGTNTITNDISIGYITTNNNRGVVIYDTVKGMYVGAELLEDNNLHTANDYFKFKQDWVNRVLSGTYKGNITEIHTFEYQTDVYKWLVE